MGELSYSAVPLLSSSPRCSDSSARGISRRSSSDGNDENDQNDGTIRLLNMDEISSGDIQNDRLDETGESQCSLIESDHELDGLTLFEKKSVLINREIDAQGMGKYQWWIWGLCGFGYLLDLLWAQAFGLILSPIQQEFGFSSTVFRLFH
jgi:hypothetical protein